MPEKLAVCTMQKTLFKVAVLVVLMKELNHEIPLKNTKEELHFDGHIPSYYEGKNIKELRALFHEE
jgi:hypothetical protein